MKGLLGAFFAQVIIITYRSVAGGGIATPRTAPLPVPLPSEYTAAALIYGVLAIMPDSLAPVPALIGWGLVVTNVLGLFPLKPKEPRGAGTTLGTTKSPLAVISTPAAVAATGAKSPSPLGNAKA